MQKGPPSFGQRMENQKLIIEITRATRDIRKAMSMVNGWTLAKILVANAIKRLEKATLASKKDQGHCSHCRKAEGHRG